MGINWDNVERLRTRDGYLVLGSHLVENELIRCRSVYRCVSIRRCDGSTLEVRVNCETGEVPNRDCDHLDIIELPPDPPKPREVIRWAHPDVFTDYGVMSCTVWSHNRDDGAYRIRIRIIEEPEVKND